GIRDDLVTGVQTCALPILVNSVGEATMAVAACRYPPTGIRSMGPIRARAVDSEWRQPICVVMIETVEAVARAREILAVPGIDARSEERRVGKGWRSGARSL